MVEHAERYRIDYNTVRPHEALSWNRSHNVHIERADRTSWATPRTSPANVDRDLAARIGSAKRAGRDRSGRPDDDRAPA